MIINHYFYDENLDEINKFFQIFENARTRGKNIALFYIVLDNLREKAEKWFLID